MPLLGPLDDRQVREAEVFYYSEHMDCARLDQLCNLAFVALQVDCPTMEMARSLKCSLDKHFPGGNWMVIIGKTFGAHLTVDARNFVHFRIGRTYFVLHRQN